MIALRIELQLRKHRAITFRVERAADLAAFRYVLEARSNVPREALLKSLANWISIGPLLTFQQMKLPTNGLPAIQISPAQTPLELECESIDLAFFDLDGQQLRLLQRFAPLHFAIHVHGDMPELEPGLWALG